MNAYDLNGQILNAVGRGMNVAANRFAQRMNEIQERKSEMKVSEYWKSFAYAMAQRVDELTLVLRRHAVDENARKVELSNKQKQLISARIEASQWISEFKLASQRAEQFKDALIKERATRNALASFKDAIIGEFESGVSPHEAWCLDPKKRLDFLDSARDRFLADHAASSALATTRCTPGSQQAVKG